jgi:hypothetical protein
MTNKTKELLWENVFCGVVNVPAGIFILMVEREAFDAVIISRKQS